MQKFISGRYMAGFLFVVAFTVFFFAQQDTSEFEKRQMNSIQSASKWMPSSPQTADNNTLTEESLLTTSGIK